MANNLDIKAAAAKLAAPAENALLAEANAILDRMATAGKNEIDNLSRSFGQRLQHLFDRLGAAAPEALKAAVAPPIPAAAPVAAPAAPAPARVSIPVPAPAVVPAPALVPPNPAPEPLSEVDRVSHAEDFEPPHE
jgi:hypothetical protein